MTPEISEAVRELLARQAIIDLVHTYCRASDRHDHALLRTLYHDDATDDHGGFFKGLAMEFIDRLPEIQAPMEILHHNITSSIIALDGDYAEGEHYVLAYHKVAVENGAIDLLIGGRYLDQYQCREGHWKFSHRAVLADWATVNDPSRVDLRHPLIEGSHIGCPGEADPSYAFFRLLGRGGTPTRS